MKQSSNAADADTHSDAVINLTTVNLLYYQLLTKQNHGQPSSTMVTNASKPIWPCGWKPWLTIPFTTVGTMVAMVDNRGNKTARQVMQQRCRIMQRRSLRQWWCRVPHQTAVFLRITRLNKTRWLHVFIHHISESRKLLNTRFYHLHNLTCFSCGRIKFPSR